MRGLLIAMGALLIAACGKHTVQPAEAPVTAVSGTGAESNVAEVIVGRVTGVLPRSQVKEPVTVCHFNAGFVVVIETEDGVRRLAIHSPAMSFAGVDPVGKRYRFPLVRSSVENIWLLDRPVRIDLDETGGDASATTATTATGSSSGGRRPL